MSSIECSTINIPLSLVLYINKNQKYWLCGRQTLLCLDSTRLVIIFFSFGMEITAANLFPDSIFVIAPFDRHPGVPGKTAASHDRTDLSVGRQWLPGAADQGVRYVQDDEPIGRYG
jgi:hypothetical protein